MMRLRKIPLLVLVWLLAGLHAPTPPIAVPERPGHIISLDDYRARRPQR